MTKEKFNNKVSEARLTDWSRTNSIFIKIGPGRWTLASWGFLKVAILHSVCSSVRAFARGRPLEAAKGFLAANLCSEASIEAIPWREGNENSTLLLTFWLRRGQLPGFFFSLFFLFSIFFFLIFFFFLYSLFYRTAWKTRLQNWCKAGREKFPSRPSLTWGIWKLHIFGWIWSIFCILFFFFFIFFCLLSLFVCYFSNYFF